MSAETRRKISESNMVKVATVKGKICITNGLLNVYQDPKDPIPEGWRPGLTQHKKKKGKV